MKTRKLRKFLMLLASALLLVSVTVGATVAYLTSTTEVVENTFTVGNVKITLDEAKVTTLGVKDGDTRVIENEYKLLPGHTYVKDPTVHVDAGSESGWLFVKVVNGISEIEAAGATTIAAQMADNGWIAVPGETGVYAYNAIVNAGANKVVFENFTISGDVKNEALAGFADKTVTIQAYMVQADGFESDATTPGYLKAWEDAPSDWKAPSAQ